MNQYKSGPVSQELHQHLIEAINAFHGENLYSADTGLFIYNLPFLMNFQLLEVTDYNQLPFFRMNYAIDGGELILFDGTDEPISKLAELGEIRISLSCLKSYLSFFFSIVRFNDGYYRLAESPDEMVLGRELSGQESGLLSQALQPLAVYKKSSGFLFDITVIAGDRILWLNGDLAENGLLKILSEETILNNIPVVNRFP